MKHTPGPWTVEVGQDETSIESAIQTIATNVSNCDALLIAAAPELLEALVYVRARISDSDEWWMDCPDKGGFDVELIDRAIAKAKGEQV